MQPLIFFLLSLLVFASCAQGAAEWPQYDQNPFVFQLDLPAEDEGVGGIIVADVSGDWREELIVVSGNELHVYHNPAPNLRPYQPRLWEQASCRRSKQTWNYYSP